MKLPLDTSDHAIETFDLGRHFYGRSVLHRVRVRVPRGTVYGLLGRNGSGKTTLIRILLGILKPGEGHCEVLGLDPVHSALEIRSRVGYVPQESDFDPQMTVRETLEFFRSFYPGSWNDVTVEVLLERFELSREPRVEALSVGQRARLALVTALAFDPEMLILDEPTAGLDAVVRRDFVKTVIELMARPDRTVFLCSHQLDEVEMLADRVGIIEDGRLLLESTVDELKESLDRTAARFDGDSSLESIFVDLVGRARDA